MNPPAFHARHRFIVGVVVDPYPLDGDPVGRFVAWYVPRGQDGARDSGQVASYFFADDERNRDVLA
jgi:hypothetical protein